MTKNMKLLAAGCLTLFLAATCCLIAVVSINYMYLNDLSSPDVSQEYSPIPDFPTGNPGDSDPSAPPDLVQAGAFVERDCPFFTLSEQITCGYLGVPEDHYDPNSRTISLAVAIIHGPGDTTSSPPLVYLEGGPGGSALDGAASLWLDSPLTAGREVILVDQRGTGYSSPTLNCTEYEDPEYAGVDELDLLADCRQRLLDSGIDLNLYTSQQSAADIAMLRLAMGYDQVDLLGVSYGTRLALTVMRDHPEGVRSVILDSVYPPQVDALNEEPLVTLNALITLTDGCQADPACRQAYPDLESVLFTLIEALENDPVEVEFWDAYRQDTVTEDYYGLDLIYTLIDAMYDSTLIPYLPAFIASLDSGEVEAAFEILDLPYTGIGYEEDFNQSLIGEDVSDSEGAYLSVECYDEAWFNSVEEAAGSAPGYPIWLTDLLVYSVAEMLETCQMWGSQPPSSLEDQPVSSQIPTLLLNGAFDPVTPPAWAEQAAASLTNAQVFIFPGYGHAVIDAGSCPIEMMVDFLDDPAQPLETACFEQLGPPAFVIFP